MSASQINGVSWDPDVPLKNITFNTTQEWRLSATNSHAFHLHLYHMQVQGACGAHEVGEWYDSISSSGEGVVRFKTVDIGLRCIRHCHVLDHEDKGAMTWVNVTGNGVPPASFTNPQVAAYSC